MTTAAHNTPPTLPFEREVNVVGKFILTHPQWQRAFVNFEPKDIINVLLRHMKSGTIKVSYNEQDEINGVLLYTVNHIDGIVEVPHLIGTGSGVVQGAIEAWRQEYPEYAVTVMRRGVKRVYTPDMFFIVETKEDFSKN